MAPTNAPSQASRLTLEGDLTIYEASLHKARLQAALEQADEDGLELDLSRVAEIDTAGLQILLLARRESQRLQLPLRITGVSGAVRDAIGFCRLDAFFGESLAQCAAD
ncbi:MAG: STAS domain-containing protein [Alcaligenaceae bacterium]|nr:STAS domain-containing protein [Alcaligenaceae bacterium]